jgi:hypothetical protein
MNRFKDHLDTLKTKLTTEDDFSAIYDYFFTHLGEDNAFLDYGKLVKKPALKAILQKFGEYLFGEDAQVTHLMIINTRKTKFYHGSCFINGRISGIFYFEDIEMGMAGVSMSPTSHRVEYFRFTSTHIQKDKNVVLPQGGKKTIH